MWPLVRWGPVCWEVEIEHLLLSRAELQRPPAADDAIARAPENVLL